MNILASILLAIIAAVVLIVAKAVSVAKMINERNYSFARFGLITALWAGLTIPSVGSTCGPVGCTYGLHFGWVLEMTKAEMPANAIFFVMGGYAILSVYFLGHALGWLLTLLGACRRPAAH
ncbi:hypothetical protein [Mesorhizobium sp. M4B.F.Ca.ET.017.02.2.1]|uniref:hypothetical protein n=1 Tax=Mesorhizobium sp. M4B.F.Ca.ET.017.02.2.1 TaxID=2496649 RepID=UPI000FCC2EEC|nr:hypothetical protein [Mesorhizobium sp. M4B.F.Ca.ET.017.02.2.1]RVD24596.1 hypothetical protein EN738_15290 [Mesorhizobium sp. M4B.F.Ca.ET.017.02.2.1]